MAGSLESESDMLHVLPSLLCPGLGLDSGEKSLQCVLGRFNRPPSLWLVSLTMNNLHSYVLTKSEKSAIELVPVIAISHAGPTSGIFERRRHLEKYRMTIIHEPLRHASSDSSCCLRSERIRPNKAGEMIFNLW